MLTPIDHSMQRKVKYPVLTLNNTLIERVTQFNFLGIILHYTLKWRKHIDYISKTVTQITLSVSCTDLNIYIHKQCY